MAKQNPGTPEQQARRASAVEASGRRMKRKTKIIIWVAAIGILLNIVIAIVLWPNRDAIRQWLLDTF